MAASGVIQKGVVSVGDGSFKEIKPPILTLPETIFLSYQTPNSLEFRKSVSTRPNSLRAYWPMDEGTGVLLKMLLVEMMVP